jgi:hypothetical protein
MAFTSIHTIDEASLNRVYQHVSGNKNVKSWGMITAFRHANNKNQNLDANKSLEKDLREKGLGFFRVEGHWQECQNKDIPYAECPKDQLVDSTETSFFVPNIKKDDLHNLCKKYEQDAVVYGGEDTNKEATLIFKDGSEESVGTFKPDKVQQAYSKLKGGKTFAFNKDEPKKKDEPIKLADKLPKNIANLKIKNPKTGNDIKLKSALGYGKDSPVYKLAQNMIKKQKQ